MTRMRKGRVRGILLAALVGFLAACSGESTPERACSTNRECALTELCVDGACVAIVEGCASDFECAANEVCNLDSGTCEAFAPLACESDTQCPAGERCNTAGGICVPGNRACTTGLDCSAIQQVCDVARGRCADCLENIDCPAPASCIEGACIDPTTPQCRTDTECSAPSSVCQDGQCVAGCAQPGSPLSCTEGTVCDAGTGRCAPARPCGTDAECGGATPICEMGFCAPGCVELGRCGPDLSCNRATGRCEPAVGCREDIECGPPNAVCEGGQCVGGCAAPVGIRCAENEVCRADTGRCVSLACGSDADCDPPSTICGASMVCEPGCAISGCAAGESCDQASGRCVASTGVLNAPCALNSDCQSGVCFDFGPPTGPLCVQACASSNDCPSGYTCGDYSGAKTCISASFFPGATFDVANGASCASDGECRSSFCPTSLNQCVDTCAEDNDCASGAGSCLWSEYAAGAYFSTCSGPSGGTGVNGATCLADADCEGGVCYGSGTCGSLCGSTADCPSGNVCAPVDYSQCVAGSGGTCFQWQVNLVKACVAAGNIAIGTGAIGSPCTRGGDCRDGVCNVVDGVCTGTCSRDADCPSGMRCGIEEYGTLGSETVYFNACIVP